MSEDVAVLTRRVQWLESSIIMCIGAGICVATMVMSAANDPNLAIWAMTSAASEHLTYYTILAFGTLSIFANSDHFITWLGLVGNLLPCSCLPIIKRLYFIRFPTALPRVAKAIFILPLDGIICLR